MRRIPGVEQCGLRPRRVIVCDAGPLVAAALSNDHDHRACIDFFTGLHLAGRALLVSERIVGRRR